MIPSWRKFADRLEIAAQFIRDHESGRAKPADQSCKKRPCRLGVPLWLDKNVEDISLRLHHPPEPVFPAVDRDGSFVQMPFADRTGPVAPNAIGEVAVKAVDPLTNGFAADDHTALGQKFFDIGRAEDEPMIDPDRICDDLARKRNPFRRGNEDGIFMPIACPDQNGQTTWQSLFGGPFVPPGLENLAQNDAVLINDAPERERLAGTLLHDFVKISDVAEVELSPPQIPRDLRPEFVHPAPNGFMGDVDATVEQPLLDLPQAKIEPDIQPDRVGDDRGQEPVPLVADEMCLRGRDLCSNQRAGNR